MRVVVLGSGSKGNCTYMKFGDTQILIDVGFTYPILKKKLNDINVEIKNINYLFITHEHSDHIIGLDAFIKKHKPVIYINEKLAKKLFKTNSYEKVIYLENDNFTNDIYVKKIPTSHDSLDSCGFLFEYLKTSLVYITDTGYIHTNNLEQIKNKNYYIIESNHDITMLLDGPYPIYLKKRILSDEGHLSNEWCGRYLSKIIGKDTKKVILAHISETNNDPKIALETVYNILKEDKKDEIKIECCYQDEIYEVIK